MDSCTKFYIDGQWVDPSEPTPFDVINPANEQVIGQIMMGNADDVNKAVAAAKKAFPSFSKTSVKERLELLDAIMASYQNRYDEVVETISKEMGAPMWLSKAAQAAMGLAHLSTVRGILENYAFETAHGTTLIRKEPVGVCGLITPWNWPINQIACKVAPALAAGCTMVLKPSEETPYTGGMIFAEIFEAAGVPPGVLNVVTCSRENVPAVGDMIIEHPLIKGISFTGSTPVGRVIAAKAGAHLKKCCVELGGKDALIVCDDADMDRATAAANFGSFMHQGQICMSVEKILVQESVFDEFLSRFAARAAKLKVGDPSADKGHVIGPLINDKQAGKVREQIEDAVAKGARVVIGGGVEGRFVEPTILTGVTPDMKVYAEETFGPVVPVIPYRTDSEAIAIANDSEYGLSSGVITRDEARGLAIAGALETGMCHINCSSVNDEPHVPFGGSKSSGVGRHGGRWSTETFTETRWVTLERGGRGFPPMF